MPNLSLVSSAPSPLLDVRSFRRRACRVLLAVALGAGSLISASAQTVTETVVHSFTGTTDSTTPTAGVIQAGDGQLYGTTAGDFFTDFGSIYKTSLNGTFTTVYTFGGVTDSATPLAPVVQGADGNFYGTTYGNLLLGTDGSVFELTSEGTLTTLYGFMGGADGGNPDSGLTPLSNGNFYGVTSSAGSGNGTLFSIGMIAPLSTVVSFNGLNGSYLNAPPTEGTDGNFYGVTYAGGSSQFGTFYQLTPGGTLTTLYSFSGNGDGANPYGPLIEGPDGNFYGVTGANAQVKGSDQNGTIFKITPAGVLSTLHIFAPTTDGEGSFALFLGGDGYLYGNTQSGGANNEGTFFRASLSGAFTALYSFGSSNDISSPQAGVTQASDGTFWGTGARGGTSGIGGVFKVALSPAPPSPMQITASAATIALGDPVTLNWTSLNSFSNTMRLCNATITPAPVSAAGWSGAQTGTFNAITNVWSGSATITPLYPGVYTYGITCGGVESATTTITVGDAAALTITTQSLPTAYVGIPYSATVGISGGVSPYTFSISVGSLPAGLTLNASTGVISGTPTTTGASNVTVKVVDSDASGAATATASLGLTVLQKLALVTTTLPDVRIGSAYSQQIAVTGGTPPYVFSVGQGSNLPSGLTLSSSGLLSGTPTVAGTTPFTLVVKDSGKQSLMPTLSLTVDPLVTTTGVITLTPASIRVGGTTSASVAISGPAGAPPMTGTVQFVANGVALGSPVELTNGVATLATPAFTNSGSVAVTAFYSGDANFLATGYPSATLTVNAASQAAIVIAPSVASVVSGGATTVAVDLVNFPSASTVSFACGTLPTYLSCSFSPVVNNVSTLTINTFTDTAANTRHRDGIWLAGVLPGLLLLGISTCKRRLARRMQAALSMVAILLMGLTVSGCGGPHTTINKAGTGTSAITVTAIASGQTASTQFMLTVH